MIKKSRFSPDGYNEDKGGNGNGIEEYDLIFEDIFENDFDDFYEDGEEFKDF